MMGTPQVKETKLPPPVRHDNAEGAVVPELCEPAILTGKVLAIHAHAACAGRHAGAVGR